MELPGRPGCCWTAAARPTDYPGLSGRQRVEVAIVGGGIAGLSAALPLTQAGRSVAVIEARRIGRQVTGLSTGKITTQHALIYDHLVRTLGRDEAAHYADANFAGLRAMLGWIENYAIDCALERRSAYTYIGPEREHVEALNRETEAALGLGLPADFVDRAPLPFATGGAVRFTDQAQCNPAAYLVGLAAAVAGHGGAIYENSRVVELERGKSWRLATADGEVEADRVVLASHIPIGGPDDYTHRTQPRCHIAMAFRMAAEDLPDGMFIAGEPPVHSFRSGHDADGPLLVVLGPPFATGQEGDVAERFRLLERWTRSRFEVGAAVWRWTNEDYDTAARVPFAGQPSAEAAGLHIATGFNAWGLTNGTAAGLLIAERILDHEVHWAPVYRADRAGPDDFHRSGKTQSEVAAIDDIPAGGGGVIEQDGEMLAVRRDADGRLHAVAASCTHKGCPVTWNNAAGTWDCPCHGSIFAADGAVLHGPAVKPLAPRSLGRES